jgi:hypothetical protein
MNPKSTSTLSSNRRLRTIINNNTAMRLLTWDNQNVPILTDNRDENLPPYAILSHTWGSEQDEVTFADIQTRQGSSKAGYNKIRFSGEQARRHKIEHFWVDTCCINKDRPNELAEAITSMFRWYKNSTKCYVYLSDVSVLEVEEVGNTQSMWEADFRRSRWFTRGWTLQELLAPTNVEFFSKEGEFLGTKQTLAQVIHEVTTIPLTAIRGASLSQFEIDEKIRWTKGRKTTKREDGAYCLLGIFNVFMPLIYGEGDNAYRRLRQGINERYGSNVAARLGAVDQLESQELCYSATRLDYAANSRGQASGSSQLTLEPASCEMRPVKRPRTLYSIDFLDSDHRFSNGNTVAPRIESTSGHIAHLLHDSHELSMIVAEEKYKTLVKSLLFERIDFRINNVRKALMSTCQWLFRHPHFQTWYEDGSFTQHCGFLWIRGKPGCGKSTLMKVLFEWACKQKNKDRGRQTIVPYFFNARAPAILEKSSLGLYRTVVHHLLLSCPKLGTMFAEKFALKNPGQSEEQWTADELQEFLVDAVESNESFGLCLLIDALDEAEYQYDVRDMIRFLIQLSDRAPSLTARANFVSAFRVVTILISTSLRDCP